jgi:hypothetical protein
MADQITISFWVFLLLVAIARVAKVAVDAMDLLEIECRINRLQHELAARGALVFEVNRSMRVRVISEALRMLLLRRMVTEANGVCRAVPEEQTLMPCFANAIAQWWEPAVSRECPGSIGEQPS